MQIRHLYLDFDHDDIRRRGGCGSGASRLEDAIHSPWNFICCERPWRRPGINPEANEQGEGIVDVEFEGPRPFGTSLTNPTQVVGKRNSWPPRTLITGEYRFPFRTHELQLQCVLKEAAGNRPTANQHVDDAFVPAHH
ncbi:hypothetical protein ALC53_11165 [Atta colombica]|uniref:Uncharacterized protein n=1 Tax=Atta colombica TaxID=520822 RepID=A0A195B2K1_9HYME|nr:hypothetical protein ALC53_11165 [Atta colombica]